MTNETRTGYTAEEVKAMADAKGLPCELRKIGRYRSHGKLVQMEIVKPRSTVEALGLDREWSLYYPHQYPGRKELVSVAIILSAR
jgi:hypothetical protein